MQKKKIFISSLLVILAIGAGAFFLLKSQILNQPKSNLYNGDAVKFSGTLDLVAGDNIYATGVRLAKDSKPVRDLPQGEKFVFSTSDSTTYTKLEIAWPDLKTMDQMGGTFKIEDLPRQQVPGSLADMTTLMSKGTVLINADFAKSINNESNPKAAAVLYWTLDFSPKNQNEN